MARGKLKPKMSTANLRWKIWAAAASLKLLLRRGSCYFAVACGIPIWRNCVAAAEKRRLARPEPFKRGDAARSRSGGALKS